MSRKANPTVIGGFILGAVALGVAGVIYFGSGQFMAKTSSFVLYFDGSLAGLSAGAPVNFRGFKIGTVTDIVVRYDRRDHSVRVPVYIEIDSSRIEEVRGGYQPDDPREIVDAMVERGLRAELVLQSLVTGQMAVQFDFHKDAPINLTGADPTHVELPTIPNSIEELTKTIANLPIDELTAELRSVVQGIDQLVHSEEAQNAIRSLNQTLKDYGELARHLDSKVDPISQNIETNVTAAVDAVQQVADSITAAEVALCETLDDARKLIRNVDGQVEPAVASFEAAAEAARSSLNRAEELLKTANEVIGRDSELHYKLTAALEELSDAARSIRSLADYLEQHPEALLQGKRGMGG